MGKYLPKLLNMTLSQKVWTLMGKHLKKITIYVLEYPREWNVDGKLPVS